MSVADFIILGIVAVWILGVLVFRKRSKKDGRCAGCGGNCGGCRKNACQHPISMLD